MDDETDGWKGQPPLDRCLKANVPNQIKSALSAVHSSIIPPPNYTYPLKPPAQHTTQGVRPDGQTLRILYTKMMMCPHDGGPSQQVENHRKACTQVPSLRKARNFSLLKIVTDWLIPSASQKSQYGLAGTFPCRRSLF
jgi:hypothetical protein